MGCCGGGHNHNNQRVKDWSSEGDASQNTYQYNESITPLLVIFGVLIVGFIVYRVLFM